MKIKFSDLKKSALFILYILGFIFAFTSSIPAYVNSSFLESITNERTVGFIYTLGSVLTLIFLILIPKVLKKYGNYKTTIILTTVHFFNFLCLAFLQNTYLILLSFMLSVAIGAMIYFNLDVFLEHHSSDAVTGRIRSIYLTCINLAWLLSPLLAGVIVAQSSYRSIYFVVALIMIPIIFIILFNLRNFKDPEYKTFNVSDTFKSINVHKNIKNILISSFLLQLFYSWMVIYTPIYLNRYVGFDWKTIGIIFSIMLLPFVFIQIPLGYLSDKKYGEKEILTVGYIIMGISTLAIPFIHNNNFVVWATILFITRIGAAMVEVMNDTFFFKHVSDKNLNLINFYRATIPLSYIVSPMIATILIGFFPIVIIFYILGLLMFFALKYSLAIEDTK